MARHKKPQTNHGGLTKAIKIYLKPSTPLVDCIWNANQTTLQETIEFDMCSRSVYCHDYYAQNVLCHARPLQIENSANRFDGDYPKIPSDAPPWLVNAIRQAHRGFAIHPQSEPERRVLLIKLSQIAAFFGGLRGYEDDGHMPWFEKIEKNPDLKVNYARAYNLHLHLSYIDLRIPLDLLPWNRPLDFQARIRQIKHFGGDL